MSKRRTGRDMSGPWRFPSGFADALGFDSAHLLVGPAIVFSRMDRVAGVVLGKHYFSRDRRVCNEAFVDGTSLIAGRNGIFCDLVCWKQNFAHPFGIDGNGLVSNAGVSGVLFVHQFSRNIFADFKILQPDIFPERPDVVSLRLSGCPLDGLHLVASENNDGGPVF